MFDVEIEVMIKDVEVNVEEDCKFEEFVKVCNEVDVLVFFV